MVSVQINDTTTNTTLDLYPEAPLSVTDDKTEALDSGLMICKHLTREEPFVEGDEVTITIDSKIFYRLVETDIVTTIADGVHNHEITLIEETAKLTKALGADRYFTVSSAGAKLTYKDHLNILYLTAPLQGDRFFSIPTATTNFLDVNAGEKKYEGAHMLDNLTELFRSRDAVPRLLRGGGLTYDLYNEKNNQITLGDLTGQRKDNNLSNYALSVRAKATNLIFEGGTITAGTFFPSETEGITPRSSSNVYADSKAQWQINKGIRRVIQGKFIDLSIEFPATSGTYIDIDLDISTQVVSKEEYEGLPIGSTTIGQGVVQNNTIYHSIGGTTIANVGNIVEDVGIDPTVIELLIKEALYNHPTYDQTNYRAAGINTLKLQIFFQPYFSADITSQKHNGVNKRSAMLVGQKDKIVDLRRYSNVLKGIVNRLANSNWIIRKTHDSIADCLEIGDYTANNYQIIRRKLDIFQDKINATYELSRNFGNLDAQVSVQNKVYPYTITNDNVKSNFVYTEYIELSKVQKIPSGTMGYDGLRVLMNGMGFQSTYDTPIYHAEYYSADADITASEKISIPALCIGSEDGIRMFMEFDSPNLAGNQLILGTTNKLNPILYTDTGGGMSYASIYFTHETTVNNPNLLPVITAPQTNGLVEIPSTLFFKQPNEIFGLTTEFLFLNTDKYILYRGFAENNSLVKELALGATLGVYYTNDNTELYDIYDTELKASSVSVGSPTITPATGIIDVSALSGTSNHNWAIADTTTGELYLAVNYLNEQADIVYINLLDSNPNIENL